MNPCGSSWIARLGDKVFQASGISPTPKGSNPWRYLPLRKWVRASRNLVGRLDNRLAGRPTRFAYRLTIYTARRIP